MTKTDDRRTPADWIDKHIRDKALPPPPVNPDNGTVPASEEVLPKEATEMTESVIERLEKATGPDRGLDALLAEVGGWEWHGDGPVDEYPNWAGHWVRPGFPTNGSFGKRGRALCDCDVISERDGNDQEPPAYTASLDAALALVERVLPGTEFALSTLYGRNHAEVNMNAEEPVTAQAATLPLALCLALLKATAASEEAPGEADIPQERDEGETT